MYIYASFGVYLHLPSIGCDCQTKVYRKNMKNKAYQQICLATEACSGPFTLLLVLKYALWQDLKSCGGEKSTRRFWGLPAKIMLVRKTVLYTQLFLEHLISYQ